MSDKDDLDHMRKQASSAESKKDIKTRQHLMERSFARATRYGYKRARWRRLWRVEIQEYLTASIQNIMVIIGNVKEQDPAVGIAQGKAGYRDAALSLQLRLFALKQSVFHSIRQFFAVKCQ
jgi:hypothetical protein